MEVFIGLLILGLIFRLFFKQISRLLLLVSIKPHETLSREQNKRKDGITREDVTEHDNYTIRHIVEDGIERISYIPKNRRFETPIMFQHGMWHGAWCWQFWQELFAEWGWESHAISWPGHAGSPEQKLVAECTLDYYLYFLKQEMDRFDSPPILIGHSMGGALTQWYLKYINDGLPAAVLVASAPSHSNFGAGIFSWIKQDPMGMFLSWMSADADPFVRTPEVAAAKLISDGALMSPDELFRQLGSESVLILFQHNPPFWKPKYPITAPMLITVGEKDAIISPKALRSSADFYRCDYQLIPDTAHNMMMEKTYQETAQNIHDWLLEQGIS